MHKEECVMCGKFRRNGKLQKVALLVASLTLGALSVSEDSLADRYSTYEDDSAPSTAVYERIVAGEGISIKYLIGKYADNEAGGTTYWVKSCTISTDIDAIKSKVGTTSVSGSDSISISSSNSGNNTAYTVTAKQATVKSDDTGLVTGGDAYTELRNGAEGTYIHAANTTAANLSALDTKIGTEKGVTGLYAEDADVESQIQAVGNKTIQSITDAVSNGAGDTQKITVTTYDGNTTDIEIAGQGAVASGDVRLLNGNTAYNELRPTNGSYVKQANTTATNLSALDAAIGTKTSVSGLYETSDSVETQMQKVGNKTIQSITNAVSKGASDTQKITVKTYDGTTTNIEIAGQGAVASGDVRILNGDTIYNELRPTDGNYIKQGDTTASNLTALDTQIKINENNIRDLTGEVHQIGAGAAALAALRPEPYDPDDRWSFAAGIGHYKNGNAAALGVFFKPDENTTFSFGSTVWSGDPMINFGASFKVGSRSPYAGTYRNTKKLIERVDAIEKGNVERDATIAAQAKEIALLKADNAQMKADNAQMKAQIAEILAKLGMTKDVEKTAIVKSGPRPFLKNLVKAESKPVAKAKIKSPIKVKTKAATKSESKPVEKATAKPVAKPSVKPVAKTDAKAEVKAVSKTEAKKAINPETTGKPTVKETVKPEAKTPAKPETKTSGQTGGRPFLKELVKTDANATDKAAAKSATKADADKTADKAVAKTVSKEETKTATQTKGKFVVL